MMYGKCLYKYLVNVLSICSNTDISWKCLFSLNLYFNGLIITNYRILYTSNSIPPPLFKSSKSQRHFLCLKRWRMTIGMLSKSGLACIHWHFFGFKSLYLLSIISLKSLNTHLIIVKFYYFSIYSKLLKL